MMKRQVARLSTWWIRLFVISVLVVTFADLPGWASLLPLGLIMLALVRPPRAEDAEPRWVEVPVRGRWVGLNSPADKVPSHGVRAYGQEYAIDILHPAPQDTPRTLGWGLGLRDPESFSCFGEPVHAVAEGVVVAADDRLRDQRSRTSWPAVIWMMTVGALLRELGGPRFILGNHVILDHGEGVFSAYAHLRRGSVGVEVGDRVVAGQPIAEVGNTGNTSEPHLHVQLMDCAEVNAAAGLPFRWRGVEISEGERDPGRGDVESTTSVTEGLPGAGQVFIAHSE